MSRLLACISLVLAAASGLACRSKDSGPQDGASTAASASASASTSATAPTALTGLPDAEATPAELIDGGAKLKGKHVLVRGALGEVTKDSPKGTIVSLPKDPKTDTPAVRCTLRAGEDVGAAQKGDVIDVLGVVEAVGENVEMGSCVVNTQLRACKVVQQALGRGTCEIDKENLGARLVLGAEHADLACRSRAGFEAWRAKWASLPAQERAARIITVDTTSCHLMYETLTPRLAVDFSSALARVRWEKDVPTLAP